MNVFAVFALHFVLALTVEVCDRLKVNPTGLHRAWLASCDRCDVILGYPPCR